MNDLKWLKIKFQKLQILHQNPVIESYFSITLNERLYFSSVFDDQISLQLKGEIMIPIESNIKLDKLTLQRWQSHVIVFDHAIILNQLKTKSIMHKKYQIKKSELLTFSIILLSQKDIVISSCIMPHISQHYLILQQIKLKQPANTSTISRPQFGACYFQIITSTNQYNIPVINGNVLINLPQTLQIAQFKNNKLYGKSKHYTFEHLGRISQEIELYSVGEGEGNNNNNKKNELIGRLSFKSHWLVDISINQPIQYLLLHSNQLILYDFQLKFDIPSDFIGSKLKISCNTKMFQFSDQLGNNKLIKIKKLIWFITKSLNDHIQITIQRNGNYLCKYDLIIQQLPYYQLVKHKHKLIDINNPIKPLGLIKFNIQKSKGLNHIQNDQFWKQSIKKKNNTNNLLLQISQISFYYEEDQNLTVVIKTQNQQKKVHQLQNINFFQEDPLIYHAPIVISTKIDEIVYFMVKQQSNKLNLIENNNNNNNNQDFIGIGVINVNDIRLGKNVYQIQFYKNQQKLGTINCMINKYSPFNIIKSSFQPQSIPFGKTLDIKLSMNSLKLSPYFFSYKYDNLNQVFCIIQLNKQKKVLILQPTFQQLSFIPSSSSDILTFSIQIDQIIKIKITIMISDGLNEIIYGTKSFSINLYNLKDKEQINMKDTEFYNYTDTFVGKCNLNFKYIKETIQKYQQAIEKEKFISKRNNKSSQEKNSNTNTISNNKNKQFFNHNNNKQKSISVADYLNYDQVKQIKIVKNLLPTKKYSSRDNKINKSLDLQKRGTFDSKIDSRYQQKNESKYDKYKDIQIVKLPKIKQSKNKQSFNDILMSMNMRKKTKGGYDYNNSTGHNNIDKNPKRYHNLQQDKSSRQSHLPAPQTLSRQLSKDKSIDYNVLKNNSNMDRNFQILFPMKKNMSRQQQIKNQLNKYQEKLKGLKSVLQEISNDIGPIQPSIKEGNNTEEERDTNNFQYQGNQFI